MKVVSWLEHTFWLIGRMLVEALKGKPKNVKDLYFWLVIHCTYKGVKEVSQRKLPLSAWISYYAEVILGIAIVIAAIILLHEISTQIF